MRVAVDFDGTIVEDAYPKIGNPQLFAFETLRELQKSKHQLILWTVREGDSLQEAVDFCKKNGIEFYAVNKNYPEEVLEIGQSRKLNADVFIDDRNIGGFVGWSKVWELLGKQPLESVFPDHKRGIAKKIKKLFK